MLHKRLAEKRGELGFLVKMMEISPEMVAVVLHQAFRFTSPALMDKLVAQDADELLPWEHIKDSIGIAPWANGIVQTILQEPQGEWFMTLACALEYMHHKPLTAAEHAQLENDDDDGHADPEDTAQKDREDAGNDWLAEQGFDRKD